MPTTRKNAMRRLRHLAAAAALTLCAIPSALVHAQPLDEVTLDNGGLVKGEILVLDPGEKVVIKVPGEDQPRTIPWSHVEDVQRGADIDVPAPEKPAPPAAKKGNTVHLHVESDDPDVEVHSVVSTAVGVVGGHAAVAVQTQLECRGTCDKELEADGKRYFFAGPGIRPSEPFFLDDQGPAVKAKVDAGSAGLFIGGYMLTSVGAAGLAGGIVFTVMAFALEDETEDVGILEDFKIVGPVVMGVGAGMLAGGIAMLVGSATDFELQPETTNFGGVEIPTGRFRF